jgi:hypothetical protein
MHCANCGVKINEYDSYLPDMSASEYGKRYKNGILKRYCENCYYEDDPVITVIDIKNNTKVGIGSLRAYGEDDIDLSYFKFGYTHTDAWRGYFYADLKNDPNNPLCKYSDGWTTGMPDETTHSKALFNDTIEWLRKQDLPFTMYLIISQTSNVFSLGIDIFLKKDEIESFEEWMKEHGKDPEILKEF